MPLSHAAPPSSDAAALTVPSRVQAANQAVPRKIDIVRPEFVELTKDGTKLFVASPEGLLSVIDTATGMVTKSVQAGATTALVLSTSGSTAFLATGTSVTIVDTSAMTVKSVVPVGDEVASMVSSPGGTALYVGLKTAGVKVVDVAQGNVTAQIPAGGNITKLLGTPDGSKLYVLKGASVSVIDTETKAILNTSPMTGDDGTISPDGTRLVTTRAGEISVINTATDTVLVTFPTFLTPSAPVFTPDSKRAFFADHGQPYYPKPGWRVINNPVLSQINLETLMMGEATPDKQDYFYTDDIVVSPNGTRLYKSAKYDIQVWGARSADFDLPLVETIKFDTFVSVAAMAPDGSKLYANAFEGNAIWVIDTSGPPRNVWKDYNSDVTTDVLARDAAGILWLYPGDGRQGWLPRTQVGSGWNSMNLILSAGDFNGDAHPDVLARDAAGELWLYPGDGHSNWLPRIKVGVGWNAMTAVVTPGDFNGDGKADVMARDAAGDLWLYPGNGTGGWLPRSKAGSDWNQMTTILGPGEFGASGGDIMAKDAAGTMWLYEGNGAGGWLPRKQIGVGWNVMTAIVTPGDIDGDGVPDVLARDANGNLMLYRGLASGGLINGNQVGAGWNVMTAIL
ncbi:FG-GAP-like repeat-containing protein [Paenarthrobacter nitroguajacolicus]|uniref:FG-GAP-like repeat-containing protein n=1 Tax=Paenarthrobacter nitroguajacolicus TaxID=211146 RepID=UPI004053B90D